MNYALIRENDIANGPGVRTSLFVSGCRHHCKGCFNPETWNFNYGQPFTQQEIDAIIKASEPSFIDGLTLLGGEPLEPENQSALIELLKQIKTKLDYSTIKKKKISHSTSKVYSSMLKCYNSLNKEYVFPLFIDRDIGVYEYWQAHIIESNVDEDVMTDDEQLMLAGAYSLREIKEAVELYVKEGEVYTAIGAMF